MMHDFKSTDDLRAFILNRQEMDDDFIGAPTICWGLAWKKDRWVVKVDNKRVTEITSKDVPKGFDLNDSNFAFDILRALRTKELDGLKSYLEEL